VSTLSTIIVANTDVANSERMSKAPLILIGVLALSLLDVSFYSAKMIIDLFLSMPASRKHEAEADFIGLMMMAQGCYRPEAAMELWRRMEQTGQQGPPQILSTHPSNHNREEKIREWLPKAMKKAQASECHVTGQFADQFSSAFGGFSRRQ
jgi:predicted Zn-dependent protease